jgi:para-nitrobenzyl esterase
MSDVVSVVSPFGELLGRSEDGVRRFLGIPYAAAPIGEGRFRAAGAAPSWAGVREAFEFGPDSLQPASPWRTRSRAARTDEDCLYLNVWAPEGAAEAPVLVLIHGGGFQLLSGAYPDFDGATLARDGIVVVNFNYRLGILGFAGGSHWLTDQIAALRWVRQAIAAFGGSPDRITIMGVSAGGASVNALNLAPGAAGLFSQAIAVSAGGDTLFSLEGHPPLPVLDPGDPAPVLPAPFPAGAGERPAVDGELLPSLPSQALSAGTSNARRVIHAFTDYESQILDVIGLEPAVMGQLLRPLLAPADRDVTADGHALYDHLIFRAPALQLADLSAAAGVETYVLDFGYAPEASRSEARGAAHGTPFYAMIGNLAEAYGELLIAPTPADLAVAEALRRRLIAFLHGAAPNAGAGPGWPAHRAGERDALVLDRQGEARIGPPLGLRELAAPSRPTTI